MKRLCILNAATDDKAAGSLKKHLVMSVRNGLITLVDEVESADIVAVLLSADFVNEERAWTLSETARRRNKAGMCRLLPIYIEFLSEAPEHLALLLSLPRGGKPVRGDEDWAAIASEIRTMAVRDVT